MIDPQKIVIDRAIRCSSEEEANNLLKDLTDLGYVWTGGESCTTTFWDVQHGNEMFYVPKENHKIKYSTRFSSYVNYSDIQMEESVRLTDRELSKIRALLERAKTTALYIICKDHSLMREVVKEAIAQNPFNKKDWIEVLEQIKPTAIYFHDGYLFETDRCPEGYESITVDEAFLDTDEITTMQTINNKKETKTMNIFGINMEFGANSDENITSSLFGVAVKNGETWRVYNKEKKTLTDIGDMSIGSFPLYIMPSSKLEEGDLIKDNGSYYYVIESGDGNVKTVSAATGKIEEVIPVSNILGIRFYSKVMALTDGLFDDFGKGDDTETLLIAAAMSSTQSTAKTDADNQNQVNQMLLPLLLLKNGRETIDNPDGGAADSKKSDKLIKTYGTWRYERRESE